MPIDMVQKLIVEVDSMNLLRQYLKLAMITALDSCEEIAIKMVNRNEKHLGLYLPPILSNQDKHFPVILINGWFSPKEWKTNSYFSGYAPWITYRFDGTVTAVDAAIPYIQKLLETNEKIWKTQFQKKFGDGYHVAFNQFDGLVGIGYELRTCGCFPEWLAISLVHVYYGK